MLSPHGADNMLENHGWDYFYLDGFHWVDLLEFLGIPHYSNKNRGDKPPLSYEIRTIKDEQFLIIWQTETRRPTDKEIQTQIIKDQEEDED